MKSIQTNIYMWLISSALLVILLNCSCRSNNTPTEPRSKDSATESMDNHKTESEVEIPSVSKLEQLNRELERTRSYIMIKELEISHRLRDANLAAYQATLPSLDSIEKEIAIEKLDAAKKVLDESYSDKEKLMNDSVRLKNKIDSLKENYFK